MHSGSKYSSRRVARNTAFLYFRMLLVLGISLYTSRVVLKVLGIDGFGVFNVVGGVVAMLVFLNDAMASASLRFLSFELGVNEKTNCLRDIFSSMITMHLLLALCIFLAGETIGLWFLNARMNIPTGMMGAVNWVYQFSLFSATVTVMTVPFSAQILAYERMGIFAWLSVIEASLKLLGIWFLSVVDGNKLSIYGLITFLSILCVRIINILYCRFHFPQYSWRPNWNKARLYEMSSFAGWNLFGQGAAASYHQGVNIVLNLFFGPVVNAARGISYQVNSAISGFVLNFQIAVKPQITKTYAAKEFESTFNLIAWSSKLSFILLFFISFPIFNQLDYLLNLWLSTIPPYAAIFCKLMIINAWIESFSGPFIAGILATGVIRNYQMILGGLIFLNLPLSYVALKFGASETVPFFISIAIAFVALLSRLYFLRKLMNFPVMHFIKTVLARALILVAFCLFIHYLAVDRPAASFWHFCLTGGIDLAVETLGIYFLMLCGKERKMLFAMMHGVFLKIRRAGNNTSCA